MSRRAAVHTRSRRRGFVLLPVTLLLAVIAAAAWMLSREGAAGAERVAMAEEGHAARYVAEAGLAHAEWSANASACTGYGVGETAFGAHSYNAVFTPASGSPVAIAATGTLAGGAQRSLTRAGVRVFEPSQSLVLQPDSAAGKDTYLYEWKSTWNYGLSPDVYVSNDFADSETAGLLQFDLSGVPPEATVLSATLDLSQNMPSSNGGRVNVHAVTSDWIEGVKNGAIGASNWGERDAGVAWTTPGGDYEAAAVASNDIAASYVGPVQWDVTALVDAWVRGARVNRGLALVPASPGTDLTFDSSDVSTPANRPMLTVVYACECGAAATASTLLDKPGAAAGQDTHLLSGAQGAKNYGAAAVLWVHEVPHNALFRFALGALPVGAQVQSATFELYVKDVDLVSNGVASVHRITRSWTEGSGGSSGLTPADGANWATHDGVNTWASPGGDQDATALDSVTLLDATPQWYAWDVTSTVANWAAGTQANHGLLVKHAGGVLEKMQVESSDSANAALHPKLTVTYTCPCGVDCSVPTYTTLAQPGASGDDAEQIGSTVTLDSTDLNLTADGASNQTVGIRFPGLAVPPGAEIVSATVDFTVDETGSDATSVTFAGEAADDAAAFTTASDNITLRPLTTASVDWSAIAPWGTVGASIASPDLSAIVQEIVDRPGWAAGNALALVVTGSGTRTAEAWDGVPALAPVLRVKFSGAAPAYPEAYVDLFESDTCDAAQDYARSDGTVDWTGQAWTEIGDLGGDPCAGDVRLAVDDDDRALRIAGSGNGAARALDLGGATHATLKLDYRRQGLDASTDHLAVEVSGNGFGWTEVGRIEGPGTDAGYRPFSADILAYAAADTAVRLRSGGLAGAETMYLDDVRVDTDAAGTPACAGTLADDFESGGYAGSTGSVAWAAAWAEIGEADGPASGDITSAAFGGAQALHVANKDSGAWRGADLSAYTAAVLEYAYRRDGLGGPDKVFVEISGNGGASWTQLESLGSGSDADWVLSSFDVSAYLGSDLRLRFVGNNKLAPDDVVYVDRVSMCLN